jgi:hypothetical protein
METCSPAVVADAFSASAALLWPSPVLEERISNFVIVQMISYSRISILRGLQF